MDIARDICTDSFYIVNSGLPCIAVTAVVEISMEYQYKSIRNWVEFSMEYTSENSVKVESWNSIEI